MNSISVIPVGTKAVIGGNVEGSITAISIRENGYISYEVEWWDGRCRRVEWFAAGQVSEAENRIKIGFVT